MSHTAAGEGVGGSVLKCPSHLVIGSFIFVVPLAKVPAVSTRSSPAGQVPWNSDINFVEAHVGEPSRMNPCPR